jgi:hypothetical protein
MEPRESIGFSILTGGGGAALLGSGGLLGAEGNIGE